MQSEFDFIKRIRDQATERRAPADTEEDLVFGVGDDAAILREREGRETLLTVDMLVEEIDSKLESRIPSLFRRVFRRIFRAGRKTLRNVDRRRRFIDSGSPGD